MRCPTCGYRNSNLATRCQACGSSLQLATIVRTRQRPQPTAAPAVRVAPRQLGHVGEFLRSHQRAIGMGLALVVLSILGIVWLAFSITNAPTYSQIEADVATLVPSFDYAGGAFGPDLQVPLSAVTVTNREAASPPDDANPGSGIGPSAYVAEVQATYDNDLVRISRTAQLTYVQGDDGWAPVTNAWRDLDIWIEPTTGVMEDKVLSNMPTILAAAGEQDGAAIADVYADASYEIAANSFEAGGDSRVPTNDLVIHCVKDQGFFVLEGNITARFAFESGAWSLREAQASDNATSRNYDPLKGTWSGELVTHDAYEGKCYGASEQPASITIDHVGDATQGAPQVRGTITAIAHFHERLGQDEPSHEGDTLVEGQPFWGTLQETYNEQQGSSLVLQASTAGEPNGDLSFVVCFGNDADPTAVTAEVTSTYEFEERMLLLIPHRSTARFVDTYVLAHTP